MQDAETPPVPEMPPLAGEDRALVAKYPMPKGVPDAEVNKNLLGAALDVSTTTIDKWLVLPEAERIPFVERGTNGRSYVFRLSVAYAWRMARDAQDAATRQHAEDATAQLRMELLGGSIQDLGRAALSPKEQEQALKVEKEWILAAAARREFLRASDVAQAFEASFVAIRDGLDAAPDRLARELNLPPAAVEVIQEILDDVLHGARTGVDEGLLSMGP
ncbi:hypothetical protein [Phaeobacter sp. 11ANDIMAR09]|uniref:hypothetical protein n=1 Tax=Phaeobacter sp. 11ANDIMAR09 TaxID=1225647 RepID=UPI0006C88F9B|nr:hypothetical protein [Phaeobacter sp. 11ANDIMAR09]